MPWMYNSIRFAIAWTTLCLVAGFQPSQTRKSLLLGNGIHQHGALLLRQKTPICREPAKEARRHGLLLLATVDASPKLVRELEDDLQDFDTADAVICGGGPAGLLTAIMLAQTPGYQRIRLFDRLAAPPSPDDNAAWSDVAKFYLLGLGGRGQAALQRFGVWDDVKQRCIIVRGRRDWSPGGPPDGTERVFGPERLVQTHVLPRDKLVSILHQHIVQNYADRIELNYGCGVNPISFKCGSEEKAVVQITPCQQEETSGNVECDTSQATTISTGLLIAADGTVRTVANKMEEKDVERRNAMNPIYRLFAGPRFKVKRYEDDNQRVYKTIPFTVPWRPDLNYSARTNRIGFDALPANHKAEYCGVLLMKKDDPLAMAGTDPQELRQMLDDEVPQFSTLISDDTIRKTAIKPVSFLPGFRYAGPRLHEESSTLLIGDCAHTVKPYFVSSLADDVKNQITATFRLTKRNRRFFLPGTWSEQCFRYGHKKDRGPAKYSRCGCVLFSSSQRM
jgi:2-polyprenyl-6-methoxyphenol hydroxylase-like FAD-dependent oxidoreductase